MWLLTLSLAIPICSYIFQISPRIWNKYFGVDVWTRLLETRHLKQNNRKIPRKKLSKQFIISGHFDYPPVFPWLLSHFSDNFLLQHNGLVAPFFDACVVFLVFWLSFYLEQSILIGVLAQLMYMVTPMIVLENSYLTPRSLGYLNFFVVISLLLMYYVLNLPTFTLAFVFGTLIFLSHRFATQSYFFALIFLSIYFASPLFISFFVLSLIAAIVVTNGYYLRVLKGHLSNIYFWVVNLDNRFAHQIRGNQNLTKKSDWVEWVYWFISKLSPIAAFGMNPWIASGFGYYLLVWLKLLTPTPLFSAFASLILFFYGLCVAVLSIRYLMPIGEGQRYLEMVTPFGVILSAVLWQKLIIIGLGLPATVLMVLAVVGSLLISIFLQIKGVMKDKKRSITSEMNQMLAYIDGLGSKVRIACLPHQNTTLLIYHTQAQVLVNADNPGLLELTDFFPVLKISLDELQTKYQLSHLLLNESFVTQKELTSKGLKSVKKFGDLHLLKFS